MGKLRGNYDPEQTRFNLLQAGMEEIHMQGFRAASMDRILKEAGVTKGALYHHFKSKKDLGYAVVKEFFPQMIREMWGHLPEADDPIQALIEKVESLELSDEELVRGCPINNLANEMAPIDDQFRVLVENVLQQWRDNFANALQKAQNQGLIRKDVPIESTAAFLVCMFEGMASSIKNSRNREMVRPLKGRMIAYVKSLAPVTVEV